MSSDDIFEQHCSDIAEGHFAKCTNRILNATDQEIANLPTLRSVVRVARMTRKKPKATQDILLCQYASALITRRVDLNDNGANNDGDWGPFKSDVAAAAAYGYPKLLKLLLVDANCFITLGSPRAFIRAVAKRRYECITILLEHRKEELQNILHEEELAYAFDASIYGQRKPAGNALQTAVARRDVIAVQILRDKGNARISDYCYWKNDEKLPDILAKLYEPHQNILAWSKHLHWSFPTTDRQMINYLWNGIAPKSQFPKEVWLIILSFVKRGWWMDPSAIPRGRLIAYYDL
ncbi:expressed unknown protein [Seminavis robusta]|uniref:Uncharacterized protein n=1 Tax=Seminavis robusta TaxID=568900 RepID=A0A9N8DWQ2_9STRA|nr:expressed unknown protein [Seminavis robusta]|eukprot:Sro338_g120770.1 n/a (292) ;mRNA; r:6261-7136